MYADLAHLPPDQAYDHQKIYFYAISLSKGSYTELDWWEVALTAVLSYNSQTCNVGTLVCTFGDAQFRQFICKLEYRTQLLHHVAPANLEYVIFAMASDNNVVYVKKFYFFSEKRKIFLEILAEVYNHSH